jgi:AcrR family transcriptional regulator
LRDSHPEKRSPSVAVIVRAAGSIDATSTSFTSMFGCSWKSRRSVPEQRRDQILDVANTLFAERAYDKVSIEDIAGSAGVTRGLVHHYFGGRKDVYIGLLERLGAQREQVLRPPVGRSARARVADSVSRWLDWTAANRTIWLSTMAHGEDIADPDIRGVVADLVRRAVALLATFHADIAEDSPRLRYALECWTGLNRAATRRWLRGEATREATHELLASTLEHVLRTFGAPPAPRRRTSPR